MSRYFIFLILSLCIFYSKSFQVRTFNIKSRIPGSGIRPRLVEQQIEQSVDQHTHSSQIHVEGVFPANEKANELDLPPHIQNFNKATIAVVKNILTLFYGKRHIARFAALETIARVPYFSYTSVLHLYETFGMFRKKEIIQLHFAESWNELHHLLILEYLGGNKNWFDRALASYIAFFYYWIVVFLYMVNPAIAYDLNKHVETHAYESYNEFLKTNGEELKQFPPPTIAKDYYQGKNMHMFDAFHQRSIAHLLPSEANSTDSAHTAQGDGQGESVSVEEKVKRTEEGYRRPLIQSLFDVFYNIREDEREHAQTMRSLQRNALRFGRKLTE